MAHGGRATAAVACERTPCSSADAAADGAPRLERRDAGIAAAIVLAVAAICLSNGGVLPGNDATPNVYLAARILEGEGPSFTPSSAPYLYHWILRTPGGDRGARVRDLDEAVGDTTARALYRSGALVPVTPYYLAESVRLDPSTGERRAVGLFGVGAALTALPVLAVVRASVGDLVHRPDALWLGAKLAATLLVALSAGVLFVLCRRWLGRFPAALLAIAYALATPAWSTSSQTLWQHASNELFLALGALALSRATERPRAAALAGIAFAAAAACRPTSVLFALAAAGWLALVNRRAFAAFALGAAPIACALGAYNAWFLGSPFRFGQGEAASIALEKTGSPEVWPGHLGSALAGLLLSPSRGVLAFSPFLVLAPAGAVVAFRRERYAPLRPIAVALALELAVAAAHFDWWGGWSYGWRRLADLGPALVLLLVPTLGWLAGARWRQVAFAALLAWSVAAQAVGAFAYDVSGWNARPGFQVTHPSGEVAYTVDEEAARAAALEHPGSVRRAELDVDRPEHRHRLWSLRDSQIGWYLAHFDQARIGRRGAAASWIEHWRLP